MEYAGVHWDGCHANEVELLESLQYEAAILVTGAMRGTGRQALLNELNWVTLQNRRLVNKLILFFKIINNSTPLYLRSVLPRTVIQRLGRILRSTNNFSLFPTQTERFKKIFSING